MELNIIIIIYVVVYLIKGPYNYTYRYKPGPFGKLDSSYTTYLDDSLYKVYRDSGSYYLDKGTLALTGMAEISYRTDTTRDDQKRNKLWRKLLAASAKQTKYNDSASFCFSICDSVKKDYKPFFNGWKIKHEYVANNSYGFLVSQKTTFYFDPSLTKIVGHEEIVK